MGWSKIQNFLLEFVLQLGLLFTCKKTSRDGTAADHQFLRNFLLEFVLQLGLLFTCKKTSRDGAAVDQRHEASRIVNRDGKVRIHIDELSLGKRRRYWRNPLTSVLDLKWRWIMVIFGVGFILTWLIFAVVYYTISKAHGDLEHHADDGGSDDEFTPCINGMESFTSAFLFSLETQHTIGYGSRNPHADCTLATFVVFLQFIIGVAVQCITAGIVVAKLQYGKRASKAIVFSDKACVGMCEGEVCLMIRIGNSARSELINVTGFGVLVERNVLKTGEEIISETVLEFLSENGNETLNLLWPAVIHCTKLDNPRELVGKLLDGHSELIVTVEGTLKSTGQTMQLRSSYLSHEIEVGRHMADISPLLVLSKQAKGPRRYIVDYSDFNTTVPDPNWDSRVWDTRRPYSGS